MQAQQPYPGFPSYLNGPGGRSLRRPIVIGAIAFVAAALLAAAVYFVAFADTSDAGGDEPMHVEEAPLVAIMPSPTPTSELTATHTLTPEPTASATPQPLISPPLPSPTPTVRPLPMDDRVIVFTLADMPDLFFDLSDQYSSLPGWDRPFVFGTQDATQTVAAHTRRLGSEEDERAFDEALRVPDRLSADLMNSLKMPFTELYVTGPLDEESYPSQTLHGTTLIEGRRMVMDAVAFRVERSGALIVSIYDAEAVQSETSVATYAGIMAERLGYDAFRPLLRGPYQLPRVPDEFFAVYDLQNFPEGFARVEIFPEGVPMFSAGGPANRAAFVRESPYELVATVGYEGETRLIKDIRGASGQLLFEPHQVLETEPIGDDSITVLLVTEEMRFEVTVFRAGEVEYVLAVQTEGRAPTRSSRTLARQLADAILRDR